MVDTTQETAGTGEGKEEGEEMKERPIIFNSEMVKAILKKQKMQTRRVVKPQPKRNNYVAYIDEQGILDYHGWAITTYYASIVEYIKCPYGQVGDRLWIRETWHGIRNTYTVRKKINDLSYKADEGYKCGEYGNLKGKWKPSIYMPRWASRITLDITKIRVERLQEISQQDIETEGIELCDCGKPEANCNFIELWNSINEKRGYGWDTNPFVWVVEFKLSKKK